MLIERHADSIIIILRRANRGDKRLFLDDYTIIITGEEQMLQSCVESTQNDGNPESAT